MPAATIDVDTDVYTGAADAFLEVVGDVCDAVSTASSAAGEGAGMAGCDPAGVEWACGYDDAAAEALRSGSDLATALGHLAELLDGTAANHADAEAASVPAGRQGPPSYRGSSSGPRQAGGIIVAPPPSADGSPGDGPTGWSLIAATVGSVWPNGHQDLLRSVAEGWRRGGAALSAAADRLSRPIGDISALVSPEVDAAVATCTDTQLAARGLADSYAALADACDTYGTHLDDAHEQVVDELVGFLAQEAAIQLAGVAASFFTAGGGAVAAQAVSAARIAATGVRIARILERLAELVRTVGRALAEVLTRVREAGAALRAVLEKGGRHALIRLSDDTGAISLGGGRWRIRLPEHEGEDLGHTLARHVDVDDAGLKASSKPVHSRFWDQWTAETITTRNLNHNAEQIEEWLASGEGVKRDFAMRLPVSIGRIYSAETGRYVDCYTVRTVLRRDGPGGVYVRTSFPEP